MVSQMSARGAGNQFGLFSPPYKTEKPDHYSSIFIIIRRWGRLADDGAGRIGGGLGKYSDAWVRSVIH
jgi:hypothetical protein